MGLDPATVAAHNRGMVIPGRVKNVVVILEGGPPSPDSKVMSVSCDPSTETTRRKAG